VVLLDPAPPEGLHEDVRESAAVCPGAAIGVREDA